MNSIIPIESSYRYLVFYIIGISILRGLVAPDFRYGYLSIATIQVIYPILLVLPFFIGKAAHLGYWQYWAIGFSGIVLSQIVAIGRYVLEIGGISLDDTVTVAVFIASFAGLTILFSAILAILIYLRR